MDYVRSPYGLRTRPYGLRIRSTYVHTEYVRNTEAPYGLRTEPPYRLRMRLRMQQKKYVRTPYTEAPYEISEPPYTESVWRLFPLYTDSVRRERTYSVYGLRTEPPYGVCFRTGNTKGDSVNVMLIFQQEVNVTQIVIDKRLPTQLTQAMVPKVSFGHIKHIIFGQTKEVNITLVPQNKRVSTQLTQAM